MTQNFDFIWIYNLEQIIQARIGSDLLSCDILARMMLMSRTHFYLKVKKLTGDTPNVLVRNLRLDSAYNLLITNYQLPVSTVMHKVGLYDSKHFNAIFKARFGMTPNQVRMNCREKLGKMGNDKLN